MMKVFKSFHICYGERKIEVVEEPELVEHNVEIALEDK
jgi:hypothetical protein